MEINSEFEQESAKLFPFIHALLVVHANIQRRTNTVSQCRIPSLHKDEAQVNTTNMEDEVQYEDLVPTELLDGLQSIVSLHTTHSELGMTEASSRIGSTTSTNHTS